MLFFNEDHLEEGWWVCCEKPRRRRRGDAVGFSVIVVVRSEEMLVRSMFPHPVPRPSPRPVCMSAAFVSSRLVDGERHVCCQAT